MANDKDIKTPIDVLKIEIFDLGRQVDYFNQEIGKLQNAIGMRLKEIERLEAEENPKK